MQNYIVWFQHNFPEMCEALHQSSHHYSMQELNPYHLEGDCWSHTMMVCKIAEIQGYGKEVQIAALLHDLGKPLSRGINSKNNHVRFFNHENISSYLAIDVLNKMYKEKMITAQEMSDIHILIAYHGELYRNTDPKSIYEKFKLDERLYTLLKQISYCDNLGRFSSDLRTTETEVIQTVTAHFNSKRADEKRDTALPYVELLCGMSQSSKISYLNNECMNERVVIINSELQKDEFLRALSEKKNIIVNLKNLTIISRSVWLEDLPPVYIKKAKVFLDVYDDIKIETVKKFVYPLYDEVDHFSFRDRIVVESNMFKAS